METIKLKEQDPDKLSNAESYADRLNLQGDARTAFICSQMGSLSIEDRYWEVDFFADKLRSAGKLIAEESITQDFCKDMQEEAIAALKAIYERATAHRDYLKEIRDSVDAEEDKELTRIQEEAVKRLNKGIKELASKLNK